MRQIVRDRILKRDGYKCCRCPNTENLEIDHIIPLSKGGRHDEDNFQVLCRRCNRKKSNKFDLGKFFKADIEPDYIFVDRDIVNYLATLSPNELKSIITQKFKENERVFRKAN